VVKVGSVSDLPDAFLLLEEKNVVIDYVKLIGDSSANDQNVHGINLFNEIIIPLK